MRAVDALLKKQITKLSQKIRDDKVVKSILQEEKEPQPG